MRKIKVAIVGVGNCASALVQGVCHYRLRPESDGLMTTHIANYMVGDIEFVAAFDVNVTKVGKPLSHAIFAHPNCCMRFPTALALATDPIVMAGPVMDGIGLYLEDVIKVVSPDLMLVEEVLEGSGAEVMVIYLPVGSEEAARFYASEAIKLGIAVVNCIPVFLCSDADIMAEAVRFRVPLIGDDIKSQVGATIVHRMLMQILRDRGVELVRTSQLNVGGNTDFLNMLQRSRLESKKQSKTQAVTSVSGDEWRDDRYHVGPSDHVTFLGDDKWAHIYIEGTGFGGASIKMEMKLEVSDSPNSAGIVVDAIRYARCALDRQIYGVLDYPSAFLMKSPFTQMDDVKALAGLRRHWS